MERSEIRESSIKRAVPSRIALHSIRASVTGLDWSIPFCVIRLPGTCFCTGSVRWPSPYGVH